MIIQQTLHGYKDGHKLLSGSVELSDIDKRMMLNLSDYSGSGIEKGFSSYFTGYPLPFSNYYVFAKTWYADEMRRPGCVWTHSLLIEFTDLLSIKDTRNIVEYFRRPDSSMDYSQYTEPISFVSEKKPLLPFNDKQFYQISCHLYNNSAKGLAILGKDSDEFEDQLFDIWNWQWPRMKRSFTFSTGSLSLRKYDDKPFDVQVLPYKRERSVSVSEQSLFEIIDLYESKCSSDWLVYYKSLDLNNFQKYMIRFGSDVAGSRINFKQLVNSYRIYLRNDLISVERIKKFLESNFADPLQGKLFKTFLIESYLESLNKFETSFFRLLVSNHALSNISWDYENIITKLQSEKNISKTDITDSVNYLIKHISNDHIISIINAVPRDTWADIDIPPKHFGQLLEQNQNLESENSFWERSEEIQQKWFSALSNNKNTSWSKVIFAMLEANCAVFAEDIYEKVGTEAIDPVISWMITSNIELAPAWAKILRENKQIFFEYLCEKNRFSRTLLRYSLDIFKPNDPFLKEIKFERIRALIEALGQSKIEPEVTGFLTFLMTVCYQNIFPNSSKVNNHLFQLLHNQLKEDLFDFNSWERFKWTMGGEIYDLIEQNYLSKIFNDRNKIPEWDHCEFLRRSYIAAFLNYNWPPMDIVNAITDKDTFERFVSFVIQIDEGHYLLKLILKILKERSDTNTFHYKILNQSL